jgi:hypothetical protein
LLAYKEEKMVYPDKNEGIGGFGIDEQDLLQSATNLHARTLREASLKQGKTATYFVPPSKLDGLGPYELSIPSMDTEWTDGESGQLYGKFKVVKIVGGEEQACVAEDYSVINLPGNSLFKQLEFYVNNSNVVDQSVSAYPYKCITETLLSKYPYINYS